MDMMGWFVLKRIPESGNKKFENNLEDRLDYVKDLKMDEDGDYATDFIFADPKPSKDDTSLSLVETTGDSIDVGRQHLCIDSTGLRNSHLDMLTCDRCKKEVHIEYCVQLSCWCILCKSCIEMHVEGYGNERIKLQSFKCPVCDYEDSVSRLGALFLVPNAFESVLRCVICPYVIKKWPTDAPPSRFPELNKASATFVVRDIKRMAANYIHCIYCNFESCGACNTTPYHQGKSCIEMKEEKHAAKCRYCESPISSTKSVAQVEARARSKSIRDLRLELENAGFDVSWCVEKEDFVGIDQFKSSVCTEKECISLMFQGCTRKLECGHHCCGILGELLCLPCLEKKCQGGAILQKKGVKSSGDYMCPICETQSLRKAPSIQLQCGHIVHFNCAQKKLQEGSCGPQLTFESLYCPLCPKMMRHYSLASLLQRQLELRDLVKEKALNQLRIGELDKSANSQYLEDYAMSHYRYYLCQICKTPYCGGTRDSANNQRDGNPAELICTACIATFSGTCNRREHGHRFIEYKCWYCCSLARARYTTGQVVCHSCHSWEKRNGYFPLTKECKGPEWCPLEMAHGPHKRDCCLGCMACRKLGQ